jgi:hypothetical protein
VSIANDTNALPPPTANITELTQLFAAVNLDIKDLVVLSGNISATFLPHTTLIAMAR